MLGGGPAATGDLQPRVDVEQTKPHLLGIEVEAGAEERHARLAGRDQPAMLRVADPLDLLPPPGPRVIIVGDEDDACIEPSLFLKQTIPASGLAMFPKTGHILNLEEPALFNDTLASFLTLAEAGRWPARDPASMRR